MTNPITNPPRALCPSWTRGSGATPTSSRSGLGTTRPRWSRSARCRCGRPSSRCCEGPLVGDRFAAPRGCRSLPQAPRKRARRPPPAPPALPTCGPPESRPAAPSPLLPHPRPARHDHPPPAVPTPLPPLATPPGRARPRAAAPHEGGRGGPPREGGGRDLGGDDGAAEEVRARACGAGPGAPGRRPRGSSRRSSPCWLPAPWAARAKGPAPEPLCCVLIFTHKPD
jgi:hypothetical protein